MRTVKTMLLGAALLTGTALHSQNTTLAGAENCAKIESWTKTFIEGVENSIMIPEQKLEFLFARQKDFRCMAVFDTPKGVYNCPVWMILSSDGGRTAFAQTFGTLRCEKE